MPLSLLETFLNFIKCFIKSANIFPMTWDEQVRTGFSFAAYWLREWREFSEPITERRKAKPIQSRITLDNELEIAILV